MSTLIVLDRDGVINHDSDDYIKSVDEWQPIDGSIEAIARLTKAGYTVAVATNQSGIGRQYFSLQTLAAMHRKMNDLVEQAGGKIAHIAFCPHLPDADCDCRKPKPGLIHQIEQATGLSAKGRWMIGDSLSDLQAGTAAGCKTALLLTGKGPRTQAKIAANSDLIEQAAPQFSDLAAFVDQLLAKP